MSFDSTSNSAAESSPGSTSGARPSRHWWFPILVIIAVAGWLAWRMSLAGYQTLYHVIAVLLGTLLIATWFGLYGPARKGIRWTVAAGAWFGLAATWLFFRPVYNGDMGIVGLRPRFGRDADELLQRFQTSHEAADWQTTPQDYPRFLGTGYWPEVTGVELDTDWDANPPLEVWRREIGAGWSSFAIAGKYAVTQEQRGDSELVTCYRVADGAPVWVHSDPVRFDPGASGSIGRIGPRATPTIVGDRIITQGATGLVNCLDARSGEMIWFRDTIAESGAVLPVWGKSGSPLVVDDMVIISVGAPAAEEVEKAKAKGKKIKTTSLAAYDLKTGRQRWSKGSRRASYASPILATFDGEQQIISVNEGYVTAHRVKNGMVLWEVPWPEETDTSATASQPVPAGGDRLFLSKGYGWGSKLLQVQRDEADKWSVTPLWTPPLQKVMKTKFSNVVVRDGFVYGLDEVIMQCIDLATGKSRWKKRRTPEFGHGQLMLIGDVILVLSEFGEIALVKASPDHYRELASFQALDPDDVTWNTPAFSPPHLLVRNSREAACFRLPIKEMIDGK
jgi:outer membrane protein assembly factor BamB